MDDIDYSEIDEHIRGVVFRMRAAGFMTCDSGDGSKVGEMECALGFPHVFSVGDVPLIGSDCDRLREMFPEAVIQASYNPDDRITVLEVLWPEKSAEEVSALYPYMTYDPFLTEEQWSFPMPIKEEE